MPRPTPSFPCLVCAKEFQHNEGVSWYCFCSQRCKDAWADLEELDPDAFRLYRETQEERFLEVGAWVDSVLGSAAKKAKA